MSGPCYWPAGSLALVLLAGSLALVLSGSDHYGLNDNRPAPVTRGPVSPRCFSCSCSWAWAWSFLALALALARSLASLIWRYSGNRPHENHHHHTRNASNRLRMDRINGPPSLAWPVLVVVPSLFVGLAWLATRHATIATIPQKYASTARPPVLCRFVLDHASIVAWPKIAAKKKTM